MTCCHWFCWLCFALFVGVGHCGIQIPVPIPKHPAVLTLPVLYPNQLLTGNSELKLLSLTIKNPIASLNPSSVLLEGSSLETLIMTGMWNSGILVLESTTIGNGGLHLGGSGSRGLSVAIADSSFSGPLVMDEAKCANPLSSPCSISIKNSVFKISASESKTALFHLIDFSSVILVDNTVVAAPIATIGSEALTLYCAGFAADTTVIIERNSFRCGERLSLRFASVEYGKLPAVSNQMNATIVENSINETAIEGSIHAFTLDQIRHANATVTIERNVASVSMKTVGVLVLLASVLNASAKNVVTSQNKLSVTIARPSTMTNTAVWLACIDPSMISGQCAMSHNEVAVRSGSVSISSSLLQLSIASLPTGLGSASLTLVEMLGNTVFVDGIQSMTALSIGIDAKADRWAIERNVITVSSEQSSVLESPKLRVSALVADSNQVTAVCIGSCSFANQITASWVTLQNNTVSLAGNNSWVMQWGTPESLLHPSVNGIFVSVIIKENTFTLAASVKASAAAVCAIPNSTVLLKSNELTLKGSDVDFFASQCSNTVDLSVVIHDNVIVVGASGTATLGSLHPSYSPGSLKPHVVIDGNNVTLTAAAAVVFAVYPNDYSDGTAAFALTGNIVVATVRGNVSSAQILCVGVGSASTHELSGSGPNNLINNTVDVTCDAGHQCSTALILSLGAVIGGSSSVIGNNVRVAWARGSVAVAVVLGHNSSEIVHVSANVFNVSLDAPVQLELSSRLPTAPAVIAVVAGTVDGQGYGGVLIESNVVTLAQGAAFSGQASSCLVASVICTVERAARISLSQNRLHISADGRLNATGNSVVVASVLERVEMTPDGIVIEGTEVEVNTQAAVIAAVVSELAGATFFINSTSIRVASLHLPDPGGVVRIANIHNADFAASLSVLDSTIVASASDSIQVVTVNLSSYASVSSVQGSVLRLTAPKVEFFCSRKQTAHRLFVDRTSVAAGGGAALHNGCAHPLNRTPVNPGIPALTSPSAAEVAWTGGRLENGIDQLVSGDTAVTVREVPGAPGTPSETVLMIIPDDPGDLPRLQARPRDPGPGSSCTAPAEAEPPMIVCDRWPTGAALSAPLDLALSLEPGGNATVALLARDSIARPQAQSFVLVAALPSPTATSSGTTIGSQSLTRPTTLSATPTPTSSATAVHLSTISLSRSVSPIPSHSTTLTPRVSEATPTFTEVLAASQTAHPTSTQSASSVISATDDISRSGSLSLAVSPTRLLTATPQPDVTPIPAMGPPIGPSTPAISRRIAAQQVTGGAIGALASTGGTTVATQVGPLVTAVRVARACGQVPPRGQPYVPNDEELGLDTFPTRLMPWFPVIGTDGPGVLARTTLVANVVGIAVAAAVHVGVMHAASLLLGAAARQGAALTLGIPPTVTSAQDPTAALSAMDRAVGLLSWPLLLVVVITMASDGLAAAGGFLVANGSAAEKALGAVGLLLPTGAFGALALLPRSSSPRRAPWAARGPPLLPPQPSVRSFRWWRDGGWDWWPATFDPTLPPAAVATRQRRFVRYRILWNQLRPRRLWHPGAAALVSAAMSAVRAVRPMRGTAGCRAILGTITALQVTAALLLAVCRPLRSPGRHVAASLTAALLVAATSSGVISALATPGSAASDEAAATAASIAVAASALMVSSIALSAARVIDQLFFRRFIDNGECVQLQHKLVSDEGDSLSDAWSIEGAEFGNPLHEMEMVAFTAPPLPLLSSFEELPSSEKLSVDDMLGGGKSPVRLTSHLASSDGSHPAASSLRPFGVDIVPPRELRRANISTNSSPPRVAMSVTGSFLRHPGSGPDDIPAATTAKAREECGGRASQLAEESSGFASTWTSLDCADAGRGLQRHSDVVTVSPDSVSIVAAPRFSEQAGGAAKAGSEFATLQGALQTLAAGAPLPDTV